MDKNVHFVNTSEYYNEEFRIYDIAFLSNNIIISSDIIGQLIYYEITENNIIEKKEVNNIYPIDDLDNLISIFSIDTFNNNNIILGSSKGEIVHLKNNSVEEKYFNSKSEKISKVKYISENLFTAGDFKGNITLFDTRQKSSIKIFSEQTEEITDILYEANKPNFLLTSSIDSTLCVYDINKLSLYALSDKLDEELNCMLSYKNGNHILCGSGEGNVLIFNWDWFGDFKDMIKGHPEGINDMDKFDENIFFTGSEDGFVRICTMYPKGVRGILKSKNRRENDNAMKDVNKIKISKDKKNVITCSGMDCLRLCDISNIEFNTIYKPIDQFDSESEIENNDNNNSDNDDYSEDIKDKKTEKKKQKKKIEEDDDDEYEKDIKELENEEEDDEDEEEEEEEKEAEEDEDGIEENDEESGLEEKSEKEKSNEEENNEIDDENEDLKGIKLLNKKRKKMNNDSDEETKNKINKKEIKNDIEESSNSDSDSEDSSSMKKKKRKKVKKIGKKTKSLIAKEERKAFFNDL